MTITRRAQPAHIKWPFDEGTAYAIEKNFRTLFVDLGVATDGLNGNVGADGTFLRSNGTGPEWSDLILPNAATTGAILYASATNTMATLAAAASGNVLLSGTTPSWGKVGLTTHVSGILPVANGGTGTSTVFTPGSVIFAGASGIYTEDNSGLFFDATNNRLGIGVASPTNPLDVRSTSTIVGIYFSDSTGFGALRFFEGTTLQSSIQHIASNFGTASRRSDLELVTVLAGGDVVMRPNDTEMFRITPSGIITIGAATAPGSGTQAIVFGDGTAPGTMGSNTAAIFGNDVSGTVKLFGITEGNVTGELSMNASALTSGSVLFAGTTGLITQDNSNFFWDDTNNRLGIGTTSPSAGFHIIKTFSTDQAVGMYADIFHDTATAGTVYGGRYDATCSHSSGTMNNTIGLINSARYAGTGTALASSLQGMQCFICLDDVASPQGTITTATGLALTNVGNFATGTPAVTISQARGLTIGDIGNGNGSNGLTITNSCAMSIAGSQTAATNVAVINISNTTSVPFAPSGTWSIYNASTRNNHLAGPILMGGTTAAGGGTNYISFSNGTAVTSTAADTAVVYAADTAAGDSNLFATNEQDYVSQLTGLDIAKTADESVANNTPQNDDHLLVNLPASSRYQFKFYLFATSPATAGLLLQLDGTAGVSTLKANISIYDSTGALVAFGRKTAFNSSTGVDFTGDAYATIEGVIEVSTAGTFRLEWAQNTTDAGNATVVQEDSYLTLRKLNA